MKKYKLPILAGLAVALLVGGYYFVQEDEVEAPVTRSQKPSRRAQAKKKKQGTGRRKLLAIKSGESSKVDRSSVKSRPKPAHLLEDDEEQKLTALGKQILAEIRAALDAEDFKTLSRLVGKLAALKDDDLSLAPPGGLVHLRKAAISALGWFGAQAVPELAGFLADAQEEVREASEEQFCLALEDIEISDYERAQIVVQAAMVVTDGDFLDMLMMEVGGSMRNSVAASTLAEIMDSGTDAAKAKLPEAIEFVTGEEGVSTRDDLASWLEENPDGEDDDDLYGRIEIE